MKIPKVNSFFGCMTLETGGLVIGWLHVVGSVIGILFGSIVLLIMCVVDCHYMNADSNTDKGLQESDSYICNYGRAFMIMWALFLIIFSIGNGVTAYFCIKGTKNRNHLHVKPMLLLILLTTLYTFLYIFSVPSSSILGIILCCYEYIVIYSLYSKFQDEFNVGATAHYQEPIGKV